MRIGFIGLGNVGSKLAFNLVRNGFCVVVADLDQERASNLIAKGALQGEMPRQIASDCDLVITCLPNPEASSAVVEGKDGLSEGLSEGKIWCEMSTTDQQEVLRLAKIVARKGASAVDCPVSGGCHRAATGNISIFAGCDRQTFKRVLPVLSKMGRNILHTGRLGSASILKVLTNYLATANLVSLSEALATAQLAGLDMNKTYDAIRISSGNSFVHETESQVILNGSRNINFTMDLVLKDLSLFQSIADQNGAPLELSPLLLKIFRDAQARYGSREWSPNVIRRLEDATGIKVSADGFPDEIVDDEPPAEGSEVLSASG